MRALLFPVCFLPMPVFYGCFDCYAGVHGHWVLVRLLRLYPDDADTAQMEAALDVSFQPHKAAAEVACMARGDKRGSERPYSAASAWFVPWWLMMKSLFPAVDARATKSN